MKKLFLLLIGAVFVLTACDDATGIKNDTDLLTADDDTVLNDTDIEENDIENEDNDAVSDTDLADEENDTENEDSDITPLDEDSEIDEDTVTEEENDIETEDSDVVVDEEADTEADEDTATPDEDSVIGECDSYESETVLIKNGSFTKWSEGKPDSWVGVKTSLSSISNSLDGKSCGGSVELINNADKNLRFTTAAQAMKHGKYNCSYFVKGTGEIRNAYYDGDGFSNYSSYIPADTEWKELTYSFNLADDIADGFELIFSLRNTGETAGILLDNVKCTRAPEYCDTTTCDEWEECSNTEEKCIPLEERCNENSDCNEWEECNNEHYCVPAQGKCNTTADCPYPGETPKCDTANHTCVAGDPCENVTCDEWKECKPETALCVLSENRCIKTTDCLGTLPACDTANHTCVSANNAVNVIPNGSFEAWDVYSIPYYGDNLIPDYWYGINFTGDDNTGNTEIDPAAIIQSTDAHTGSYALKINFPGMPAERFTSEGVDIPLGNYSCHYFVKGKGDFRHRWYSKLGWATNTDFTSIDSVNWIEVPFTMNFTGQATDFRFIFYVSNTDNDNQIIIDDLVCTRN